VTRLRKMMLQELQRRNYSAITTRNYLRVVTEFTKYSGKFPDKLGPSELRTIKPICCKRHQFREFFALSSGPAATSLGDPNEIE
jgi:hypothetical protein